MVLHPAVSQIQTSCPVHEEDKEVLQNKVHAQDNGSINFDIWKEELAPTLAV